jgi:hypothetical protein
MVLTGANATEEKLKGASRSAHSACGQPRVLPERPAGGGRGPPAGQLQRRDTDPCRWARTRCCVRGPPWPGPTCGALARPTMAFSSRPTPRGLIRAAHNWWCSRLRDRTGAGATGRGAVRASPRAGARKGHRRNLSPSRRPMARRSADGGLLSALAQGRGALGGIARGKRRRSETLQPGTPITGLLSSPSAVGHLWRGLAQPE